MAPDEWSDELDDDADHDDAEHEPRGDSQEVFQSGHDRTVTERPHTFTCKVCARTLTIMQYPAPSRQVCDDCKANAAAKADKAEYMKHYMRAKRAEARAGQPPARRGRPPRQA
jgi:hypothetical protein